MSIMATPPGTRLFGGNSPSAALSRISTCTVTVAVAVVMVVRASAVETKYLNIGLSPFAHRILFAAQLSSSDQRAAAQHQQNQGGRLRRPAEIPVGARDTRVIKCRGNRSEIAGLAAARSRQEPDPRW